MQMKTLEKASGQSFAFLLLIGEKEWKEFGSITFLSKPWIGRGVVEASTFNTS